MNKILAKLSKGSIWLLLLLLVIPAAFTYFAWQITDEASRKSAHEKFTALAYDSERALRHRIESYKQALRGAVGLLEGSDDVTSAEWISYVSALNITQNSPGINGIGRIDEVNPAELDAFTDRMSADKGYPFLVHPQVDSGEYFIIRNIAPFESNNQAVGLNIAFEPNRREAATHARDTGKATITKRILLVQDAEQTPGFLLLLPSYEKGMPVLTVEQRRAAFRSWVHAPFIGKNFFNDLTDSQGQTLHLRVYDGDQQDADALIFDSNSEQSVDTSTQHESVKVLEIMEKKWLLSWTSTPAFDALEASNEPFLVLIIGAIFTGACGVFLILMGIRGSEESGTRAGYLLPAVAFVMTIGVGVYLAEEFNLNERSVLVTDTIKEARGFRRAILTNVEDRVQDLGRMANRWVNQGGQTKETWQADAIQYVADQPDLKAVEWVDSSYHVRWVEPLIGNERAIGLNVIKDPTTRVALSLAEANSSVTLSSPFDLVQGYKAVLTYSPLGSGDSFDGFIVGIFGVEELISAALDLSRSENFVVRLSSQGEEFYRSANDSLPSDPNLVHQETILLLDKSWTISVFPSSALMAGKKSFLPPIIMAISVFLAFLIAQLIITTQRSRQKTVLVQEKENLLSTFVRHTPAAVAMFDHKLCYVAASDRWYTDYGLEGRDVIGKNHYEIFPEILENHPDWKDIHQQAINGEIIKVDEEKFQREDGSLEWLRYELHPWSKGNGEKGGIIMFTENITERKQIDTMKDEFISTVNHELRTPLTSIQAALGLLRVKIGNDLDDKAKRLLFLSYENCKRLTHLVNDILDMEKITAGKQTFQVEQVEINDLVEAIVDQNLSFADKYNVVFEMQRCDEPIYMMVDPHRFNQALTNVLSNAAKFSKDGGLVKVLVENNDDHTFRILVKDWGIGIPKSFQSKIYEKFTQADGSSTRAAGGSGLGLSIAKTIIEAFDGEVHMQSEEGVGTEISFVLSKNAAPQRERNVA